MTVEFNTTEYRFSHCSQPRGRGSWAFAYRRDADMAEIFWINGTYAEARVVARKKAQADSQPVVFVLP